MTALAALRRISCSLLVFAAALPGCTPSDGDAPRPRVERVIPASGLTGGGERVRVEGGPFTSESVIHFGEAAAIGAVLDGAGAMVVTTPRASGAVEVAASEGAGPRGQGARFTFVESPAKRPGCRTFSQRRAAGCPAAKTRFSLDPSQVGRDGASTVQLAGEFTGWKDGALALSREGDRFVVDVALRPGEYEYKFIVDGTWLADPDAPSEPIFGNSLKPVVDVCLPSVSIESPGLGEVVRSESVEIRGRARPGGSAARTISESILCVDEIERPAALDAVSGAFTVSLALPEGPHRVALQVKDSEGFVSSVAWRVFTTDKIDHPPIADAGPTQFVRTGQTVLLDGSGSSDPDGAVLARHTWRTVTAPVSFAVDQLPDARVSSAEGYRANGQDDDPAALPPTTPARKAWTPSKPGTYTFELEVADAGGATAKALTQVIVLPMAGPRPRVDLALEAPEKGPIVIDATGSTRSDRAVFRWLADARNPLAFDVASRLTAGGGRLEIPRGLLIDGVWRFWVWIEDDDGASWPGAAQVTVRRGQVRVDDFLLAPAWSYDNNIYEIFVRRFRDSDGDGIGDLNGVTERLDYLKALGVDTLWLMPVFVSNDHAHAYHTTDYYDVEPDLGTREDLLRLVREAHARDMRIVLDLVINHTSRRHPFFAAALEAFRVPSSPLASWRDFFIWFENDRSELLYKYGWGRELGGERLGIASGWADIPDVNFGHGPARRYFIDVARYWADPDGDGDPSDGIDGWRLDHVTGPEHVVWNALRSELKAAYPDLLLIAEIFRDFDNGGRGYGIKDYYRGEVDAAFTFPLYWDFEGIFKDGADPRRLRDTVTALGSDRFPLGALHASFLENHDVPTGSTAFKLYGEAKLRAALSLQVALPPVPQSIWGQELGLSEFRGFAPWEREGPENGLESHFREVMNLRRSNAALRRGTFAWLPNEDEARVVTMLRRAPDGTRVVVAVNLGDQPRDVWVDLAASAPLSGERLHRIDGSPGVSLPISNARATVALGSWGSAFFELRPGP